MRPIDADKVIEELRKDRDYAEENGFMDLYFERQALIEKIEKQPTVYDVDEVVKQIKELSIREFGEIKTEDVIAIVKAGGIDHQKGDTLEECKTARKKQTVEKPHLHLIQTDECREEECWECPTCDSFLGYEVDCRDDHYRDNYCPNCGQELDWGDLE